MRAVFRMGRFAVLLLPLCTWCIPPTAALGQFLDEQPRPAAEAGVQFGEAQVQRLRVGVVVRAVGGPVSGIFATTPVPLDWPEQQVRVVEEQIDPAVRRVSYRMVDNTVRQMLIEIPHIQSGDEVRALVTFEVRRSAIEAPADTEQFVIPTRLDRQTRGYLGPSPKIETQNTRIRNLARELAEQAEGKSAWEQVEIIYDWVRENVEYEKGPLKGALAALQDGTGDCEEMTSLFVALCRLNNVPARTVWIPGHCYPEFYLEDAEGNGHWFPAQAAGTRAFGSMPEYRPILQKGDNFRVPEHRERQRYVSEFLRGNASRGSGQPDVRFIREVLPE